jgi:hypothetical protein
VTLTQGSLFDDGWVAAHPCMYCDGGQVLTRRTCDTYEDDWKCSRCSAWGNVSHSRVFGPRHDEVMATEGI